MENITVQSDCLSLVRSIRQETAVPWEIKSPFDDIYCLMLSFDDCNCEWISRGDNVSAHQLAQLGATHSFGDLQYFEGDPAPQDF